MAISSSSSGGSDSPMADMNTTPLIDVMLVLLIMFLLNIPVQTHAVKLDLPSNQTPPPPTDAPPPVIHKISIDIADNVFWDGSQVDFGTLESYLRNIGQTPKEDQPEIHVRPDGFSRYEVTNHVLAVAQRNQVNKIGFVGNEAYAN